MKPSANLGSLVLLTALCVTGLAPRASAAKPSEAFNVWPGKPPGDTRQLRGEERILEGRPRPFYQITDVATPTVSVYLPPKEKRNGAAILVCPGGGLQRLAIEHEGFEVADWLTPLGVSVFVLKYRVPAQAIAGVQDAQRALSLIRSRAGEWGIDPDTVGTLGFSAGGEIAAWLATHHDARQYAAIDAADQLSCRPDFAGLIYPGGLVFGRAGAIKEPIAGKINSQTPPMFVVHAFDDASENSLLMVLALKRARVPAELHIFQDGGHGFGVRDSGLPLGTWKDQFATWMGSQGWLDAPVVKAYAKSAREALPTKNPLPRFTQQTPGASLETAYVAQKRLVRASLGTEAIAGFKGAAASAEAQKSLGIPGPMTSVIFKSGQMNAADKPVLEALPQGDTVIETELGYVVAVDISFEVLTDQQAFDAMESVGPVIELPLNYSKRAGTMAAADTVALNIGSARYIVGPRKTAAGVDADAVKIVLKRNGEVLHETQGSATAGGQKHNLRSILNQVTSQGYTIKAGSLILCGALGKIQPGQPGQYTADYGDLGSISFELK